MNGLQTRIFSLEYTPREVKATENVLAKIYEGAGLGLKNENLAYYAGLTLSEFRQLAQLDPRVEEARVGGKADAEAFLAKKLHEAAKGGDAKAALEILKHKHDWATTQTVKQEISGANGGPITLAAVDFRGLSNEELQDMRKLLEKSTGGAADGE